MEMKRRLAIMGTVMLLMTGLLLMRLLLLATGPRYTDVALNQSACRLEVVRTRGRIYDAQLRPLAGGRTQYRAAIAPSAATTAHLEQALDGDTLAAIAGNLSGRSPFVAILPDGTAEGAGVTVFKTETRYSANTLAEHTIGYLGGDGGGVCGVELAFDQYLSSVEGGITATYTIDASGRSIAGIPPEIFDNTAVSRAGVVLTLDSDLQQLAERAADEFVDKGAVVVMELPSGELRAVVSRPSIDCRDVASYLDRDDAPLVNRALAAYDVGSVFKLVVAAAALESGISPDFACECEGRVTIGENSFHCSDRAGHGSLDMYGAIAASCNVYFIELARAVGGERIISTARALGFGERLELCDRLETASGCLPPLEQLSRPAALANLAFGQGELMATPMHLASLVGTIARGGVRVSPRLFAGLVDSRGEYLRRAEPSGGERVLSRETCDVLTLAMRMAVVDGTASGGEGEHNQAAAKTGTAQTGITDGGRGVLQAWYAGFFPYDDPRYACVVLVEDGQSGGRSAAPVFKRIADGLRA